MPAPHGLLPLVQAVLLAPLFSWPSAAAAPAPAPQREAGDAAAAQMEVAAVLRASRTRALSEEECLARLSPLLQRASEAAFEILAARRVPPAQPGQPSQTLSEPQTELLLRALEPLSRRSVLRRLDGWTSSRSDAGARLAGVAVLGAVGAAEDLGQLLEQARPGLDGEPPLRQRESAFEEALVRVLGRDPRAMSAAASLESRLEDDLYPALLRALGRSGDPRALELIHRTLLVRTQHQQLALAQVRLLGPARDPELARRLARQLVAHLDPRRPETCRAAAYALGQLEEQSAAAALVELLASGQANVRQAAHWALQRIGRVSFPADESLWRSWLAAELEWSQEQRPRSVGALLSADSARAVAGLRDLLAHPLFRHEVGLELALAADPLRPRLAALLCDGAAQLASHYAIEPLLPLLDVQDEDLAAAAHAALQACSGEQLPRDPNACRKRLFPHGDV